MDSEQDYERLIHRQRHVRGRAKIALENLKFEHETARGGRRLDSKNVDRLVRIFKNEGCIRRDPQNFVAAIIADDVLEAAIQASNITRNVLFQLGDPVYLQLISASIVCLHGKHRIAAAEQYFDADPEERWWIVDLYSPGLDCDATVDIREEYSNASPFNHGDIYRNWRFYDGRNDFEAGRWINRLSLPLQVDLKRFEKHTALAPLRRKLRELLPFYGSWPAFFVGHLRRLFSLKFPEECKNYLSMVVEGLKYILGGNEELYALADYETLSILQTRCPARDHFDQALVRDGMAKYSLFPQIRDTAIRAQILAALLQMDKPILTLYTFLQDLKWLEPPSEVIRRHFDTQGSSSIKAALASRLPRNSPEQRQKFPRLYLEVIAFSWVHFPSLSSFEPRQERKLRDKRSSLPHKTPYNHTLAQILYQNTSSCGLRLDSRVVASSADAAMIDNFLQSVRPPSFFSIADSERNTIMQQISELLSKYTSEVARPASVAVSKGFSIPQRCGRPFSQSFAAARSYFTLDNLLEETNITDSSFLLHRDIFRAFFVGKDTLQRASSTVRPFSEGPELIPSISDCQSVNHDDARVHSDDLLLDDVTRRESANEELRDSPPPVPEADFAGSSQESDNTTNIWLYYLDDTPTERVRRSEIHYKLGSLEQRYLFAVERKGKLRYLYKISYEALAKDNVLYAIPKSVKDPEFDKSSLESRVFQGWTEEKQRLRICNIQ